MTIATRPGVVEVISKASDDDQGTANFIAEALMYEALCEEIDRIRPHLERDARAIIGKSAADGLRALAQRYSTAPFYERVELAKRAEQLQAVIDISKADKEYYGDDPNERDKRGRFARKVVDALSLFSNPQDPRTKDKAGAAFDQLAGGKYEKARAIGGALQGRAMGPEANALGRLTQLVGDIGPEAERVFGRGLQRMAYRYRGTERRPDPQLAEAARSVARGTQGAPVDPTAPNTPDQARLGTIGNLGARHLYGSRAVPDMDLARISLAAGQLPPSRGILFDADGNAVSEAMGVNGDHYLPFDLKNLKRLKGGQYVRTRTSGGLTDEDIYTGLLAGARQVQVISNSGVFTVEFDPALRGGRRYSDKARQMVKRYAAITSRINDGGLVAQDIPPRELATMRQKAFKDAGGNEQMANALFDRELEKVKFESRFVGRDEEELWDEATSMAQEQLTRDAQRAGNATAVSSRTLGQRQKDIFNELKTAERESTFREYKLDAEGYNAAQKALKQEFPFFIRDVRFKPLDKFLEDAGQTFGPNNPRPKRTGRDLGYTPRGGLRPGDTGRPARGDGDAPKQGTTTPTSGTPSAPKESASGPATFADALKRPGAELPLLLGAAFETSLNERRTFSEAQMVGHEGESDKVAELKMSDHSWPLWALDTKGGPQGVATWLATEASPKHLQKAESSLKFLRKELKDDADTAAFDDALDMVKTIRQARQPFAEPAPDPVLARAAGAEAAPQPFSDVAAVQGKPQDLQKWMAENETAAQYAGKYLAADDVDAAAVADITPQVDRVTKLRNLLANGDGVDLDALEASGLNKPDITAAMEHREQGDQHQDYQDLAARQKGWALARVLTVQAKINGEEPPKLPFVKAASGRRPQQHGPRSPRVPVVKVHGPDSPAARALAARRSLSR